MPPTPQTLTILFADIATPPGLRDGGAEAVPLAWREVGDLIAAHVERHQGRSLRAAGGATAVFASASPAVACAAEIQRGLLDERAAGRFDYSTVRIGVTAGDVVIDDGEVRGRAAEAAAIITAKASPGQILVTEICRDLAGAVPGIEFADIGRYRLKGFPERVRIFEALWRDATLRPLPALERTPFVGRAGEVADMRRFLDAVDRGSGGVVLIAGEPGVGKSRLAEQVAGEARARGMTTVAGHCYETPSAPLIAVTEMIEHALSLAGPAAAEILGDDASRIATLVPSIHDRFDVAALPDVAPAHGLRLLLDAVRSVVDRASQRRPMVLILEDVHWADEETSAFLAHMAEWVSRHSVLIVATARTAEAAGAPVAAVREDMIRRRLAHQFTLQPFGEDDVGAMVRAMSGRTPEASLVAALRQETSGNAFFIEEVVRFLAEQNQLVDDRGHLVATMNIEPGHVPESVRLVIERRLERLGGATMRLLRAAAVAGRAVTLPFLEAVGEVEGDALLDAIDEAERAGILISSGEGHRMTFGFAHELSRQTILAGVSGVRRQQLHAWVAGALERVTPDPSKIASEIAAHWDAAGPAADPEKAFSYLLEAGRRALDAAAPADAAARFEAASRFARAGQQPEAEALFWLGRARFIAGDIDPAEESLTRSMELSVALDDPPAAAAAARVLIGVLSRMGRFDRARDVARRAIDAHGERRTAERAWMTGWLGFQESEDGAPETGEPMMAEALRDAESCGEAVRAAILCFRVAHFAAWGRLDEAVSDGTAAVALLTTHRDLYQLAGARVALAWSLGFQGRLRELDEVSSEQQADGQAIGHLQSIMNAHYARGLVRLASDGDIAGYHAHLDSIQDQSMTGSPHVRAHWLNHRAAADFWAGEWDRAAALYEEAGRLEPPSAWSGHSIGLLARVRALTGDVEGARRLLEQADPFLPGSDGPVSAGSRLMASAVVEAAIDAGDRERAAALYPAMLGAIDGGMILRPYHDFRLMRLVAARAAVAAERWDDAETHFVVALHHADELPVRFERPDVLRHHAAMLLERGAAGADRARAAAMLEEAADGYRRLGMRRHLDEARRGLDEARSPAGHSSRDHAGDHAGPAPTGFVLRREGHFWTVGSGASLARVKDSRGLGYIAHLVAHPSHEIHVLDLVGLAGGVAPGGSAERRALASSDAGEVLDERARREIGERIRELQQDLDEAEGFGDAGRATRAREELDALADHLTAATGLGGRSRRAGSAAERARVSVRNSIAASLKTVEAQDQNLALHLRNSIKTGAFCSYSPDRPVTWDL